MEIFYNVDLYGKISELVQQKAKYQKVMIIFDDYISSLELADIYGALKEYCIYNQMNINGIDEFELFNGYRMIIYLCSVDSFLKLHFNRDEFINVYCPQDRGLLPYFINNKNCVDKNTNYILLQTTNVDLSIIGSINFNQFIGCFNSLLTLENYSLNLEIPIREPSQNNILNSMQRVDEKLIFEDLKILKECELPYDYLVLIDLIIIDAFLVMINGIKDRSLNMVDIYKSCKEDNLLIDKFYALANDEGFINLILLNFNYLKNLCVNKKEIILNCLRSASFTNEDLCIVEEKIKNNFKKSTNIFSWIYFFNLFGV